MWIGHFSWRHLKDRSVDAFVKNEKKKKTIFNHSLEILTNYHPIDDAELVLSVMIVTLRII